MEVLHARCCGLDVHKKTVVACLLMPGLGGQPVREVRTYGTTTRELLALMDWLVANGCTHVAMESTGSYWKPVYNLLEGTLELLVVNAHHLKAVPGRKTDVRDSEWIADLLQHGLIRPSFIPSRPERELRELTRYRTTLIRERASEVNRIQKVLENFARHRVIGGYEPSRAGPCRPSPALVICLALLRLNLAPTSVATNPCHTKG